MQIWKIAMGLHDKAREISERKLKKLGKIFNLPFINMS